MIEEHDIDHDAKLDNEDDVTRPDYQDDDE